MTARTIDAHLHLWDLADGGYRWLGPQHGILNRTHTAHEARDALTGVGLTEAVLVQADDTADDTRAMLSAAHAHPWITGVVGWVPLDDPDAALRELDSLSDEPLLRGLRHLIHDDPRDDFLALPAVRTSLRAAAGRGLAFDVPDAWPRHLAATVDLARALPGLTVVLDHLGKPPLVGSAERVAWHAQLKALGRLPNTYAKVSGLRVPGAAYTAVALRPAWDAALEAFGPDRLMLGSDWPVSLLGGGLSETMAVLEELVDELSPHEQASLRAGAAAQAYRLPG